MQPRFTVLLLLAAWLGACSADSGDPAGPASMQGTRGEGTEGSETPVEGTPGEQTPPDSAPGTDPDDAPSFAVSEKNVVMWKRNAALEADLMRGLELDADEVCRELGGRGCIRDVHVIALGASDAFRSGILRPSAAPLSTTPLVVDRVLLSACDARARKDQDGPATVFTALDLAGPAPAIEDPAVVETFTTLFRRLLARDPEPAELEVLTQLADPEAEGAPESALEFATLACFTVGSSLEFLFF